MSIDSPQVSDVDLSGYYRLTKTDHLDEYLKAQGWPWVVRKACGKYGARSTDIVHQKGPTLTITSLNAKALWSRRYTVGKELAQLNAAGVACATSSWWEGKVHKSRMQAKNGDTWESWRYLEGGVLVVKSIFSDSRGSHGYMYWYFEAVKAPAANLAADQRRAMRVAASDTARLQAMNVKHSTPEKAAIEWVQLRLAAPRSKWETPADHIIERAGSAADSPRKGVVSGTTSPLSQISPMGSGILSSLPATRAHSGVNPVPPPPSEASQPREGATDGADGASEAAEHSKPERGMLKSPSAESLNALASADHERSGSGSLGGKGSGHGPGNAEALLSFLVSEFGDGRSIAAVVPLTARLAALEPELLGLSPEQAEDTQLKLTELEDQISRASAGRARHAAGIDCLCCTLVLHRFQLPDYLRAWEL